jgi:pilus assembly protein CpaF
MEGDLITLQDLFKFDYAAGMGPDGRFLGECIPTGLRPKFGDRLADVGVALPPAIFGPVDVLAESRSLR